MDEFIIRKATESDIPWLCEAIVAAEGGTTGVIPWCALFQWTENTFIQCLSEILTEDIIGQEWAYSQFYILERKGIKLSTLSAWQEGDGMQASAMIKTMILKSFVDTQTLANANERLQRFQSLKLDRTPGFLQLESIYTLPEARKQGNLQALLKYVITQFPQETSVEIQVSNHNLGAIQSYSRFGFMETNRVCSEDPNIEELYPGKCRVSMRLMRMEE